MRAKYLLFLSLIGGMFISGIAHANLLRVPTLNSPTIQAAIDAANTGDTVLVAPGTYYENVDFKGKAITVRSAKGPQLTIIDGNHNGPVVNFSDVEGTNSVIEGFTIQNGYNWLGCGITALESSPSIIGNVIQNNKQQIYYGAAIGGDGGSPIIIGNLFRNNATSGQSQSGAVSFIGTSSPFIANNVFVNNAGTAINMSLSGINSPVVINNTIVSNNVGIGVDAQYNPASQIYMNNILADNAVGLNINFYNFYNVPPVWDNNLVFGGKNYVGAPDLTGTNGNISADPMFVDPTNGDFHLQPGSPAIDAGNNAAPFLPAMDFDGGPRVIAGHPNGPAIVDMGAYEFNPTNQVPLPPVITCPEPMTVECGIGVVPFAQVFSPSGNAMTVVWSVDGIAVQTNLVAASNPPVTVGVTASLGALPLGTNLVEIAVTDSASNTASCSTTVTVVDTTPPAIQGASASPNVLWPPNHQMVAVTVNAVVSDNCGPATWKIIRVQSNEPVNGLGDGNTSPDWQILGNHTVVLRAERSGTGSGRIYTITIQAEDAAGNLSTAAVMVTVPKSMGK